jgi:alpha-amylase/alpha-mannosidase (GH57 family)
MDRYLCIHGHFYQPPRENPWLEAVEIQDSAYPYHDWNDRITDECYAANARSRILDDRGRIDKIVNTYEWISFNFGPTLLSWLQEKRPDIYGMILDADRLSIERFSGHGNALAQGYGHIILPLSNDRDRRTQVLWGIRDFEFRFGRRPEGMWLPETAANTASLEALAEHGIKFTILAPRQARSFRRIGDEKWSELTDTGIDPSRAYLCRLPSGRQINLFFYDGPVSQAVAFEKLLESGEKFAGRLDTAFDDARDWPQLVHIATDGETYGHHHRHGDMALSYALHHIIFSDIARITNYGEYLEKHPPQHEARIHEDSSWSCVHGVERWRSNCGCSSGGNNGWNQEWRAPLRAALDWLRDTVAPKFEAEAGKLIKDPWGARDEYIGVILDRSPESVGAFFERHATRALSEQDQVAALKLMELQRHAMLMYTSCGWFFDELSGIETVQVIQYAGRVVQLARQVLGQDLEEGFKQRLAEARSNIPENQHGGWIFDNYVKPAIVDMETVGAHYAIKSLFQPPGDVESVYCYEAAREDERRLTAGRARLLLGRARLTSRITRESEVFSFAVLHLGDHFLNGGVRPFRGDEAYRRLAEQVQQPFNSADFAAIIRAMDEAFGESAYGIRSLFKDEQKAITDSILETTLKEIEAANRQVYTHHAPLLRFMGSLRIKPPESLVAAARVVLHAEIRRGLRPWATDIDRVRTAIKEAREQRVELDTATIGYDLRTLMHILADRLRENPDDLDTLKLLRDFAALTNEQKFEIRRWQPRNVTWELAHTHLPERRGKPEHEEWVQTFLDMAEKLYVKVE